MTILFDSVQAVNPAPRAFGRGIPSGRRRPFVPSLADFQWAAACFGRLEDDRHLEARAEQARWDDQFAGAFPPGCCRMCGRSDADLDPVHGLCDVCLDAATDSTIACQNRNAMGAYRIF
jgi:hypothetical protein